MILSIKKIVNESVVLRVSVLAHNTIASGNEIWANLNLKNQINATNKKGICCSIKSSFGWIIGL